MGRGDEVTAVGGANCAGVWAALQQLEVNDLFCIMLQLIISHGWCIMGNPSLFICLHKS